MKCNNMFSGPYVVFNDAITVPVVFTGIKHLDVHSLSSDALFCG
jgi:hypothetical protein